MFSVKQWQNIITYFPSTKNAIRPSQYFFIRVPLVLCRQIKLRMEWRMCHRDNNLSKDQTTA